MSVPSDRILSLLDEIKSVATTASLTGGLRRGGRTLVAIYNKCLDAAEREHPGLQDLFPHLEADEGTSLDEVGVAAALLYGYLRPDDPRRHAHVLVKHIDE